MDELRDVWIIVTIVLPAGTPSSIFSIDGEGTITALEIQSLNQRQGNDATLTLRSTFDSLYCILAEIISKRVESYFYVFVIVSSQASQVSQLDDAYRDNFHSVASNLWNSDLILSMTQAYGAIFSSSYFIVHLYQGFYASSNLNVHED